MLTRKIEAMELSAENIERVSRLTVLLHQSFELCEVDLLLSTRCTHFVDIRR